jgi:hypothetical protein
MPAATSMARVAFLNGVPVDPAVANPASFNVAGKRAVGRCHGHSVQRAVQSQQLKQDFPQISHPGHSEYISGLCQSKCAIW